MNPGTVAGVAGSSSLDIEIARRLEAQGIDANWQLALLMAGLFPEGPPSWPGRTATLPAAITLESAIGKVLVSKTVSGRRAVYIKSLGYYLRRFAKTREHLPLAEISTEEIERHLKDFSGHSRATHLHRLSTLFSFAVRREWIADNPCARVERIMLERKTPRILTPEQCRKLFRKTPAHCRPYLVMCLYAGIRPSEALRLKWEDVCLKRKTITVNAAASKVRQRRVVPLPDCAVRMLARLQRESGPVSLSLITVRRWRRKVRAGMGGWPADILRHTAASYLLAWHQDAGKVATWLGNSPAILLTHYNGMATREDAELFFSGPDKTSAPTKLAGKAMAQ